MDRTIAQQRGIDALNRNRQAEAEMIPLSHQQKQYTIDHPARPETGYRKHQVRFSTETGRTTKFDVRTVQGGPAKVKPLTFLLVTFECIGKIQ